VTEQVNELVSALIDGEASEIEIHRLLRQMKDNDAHREVWVTYQETRQILRSGSQGGSSALHLSRHQHLELHRRISDAIAEDDVHTSTDTNANKTVAPSFRSKAYYKPAAGLAIAASLVVAVFVGFQPQVTDVANNTNQASEPSTVQPAPIVAQPVLAQPVVNEIAKQNSGPVNEPELRELDGEGQKRLRAYLYQHDAMARMRQDTQLVNYSKPRAK
jgi:sigma-E factor negative regulatory protein RseA